MDLEDNGQNKKDGTNAGYELELTLMVKEAVTIQVIASSSAGKVESISRRYSRLPKPTRYPRLVFFIARRRHRPRR